MDALDGLLSAGDGSGRRQSRTNGPRLPGAIRQRAVALDLEHAARRRHAAPHLKRYVDAHGHDDQGLDVVVDALRSARTRVVPAALCLDAAAGTPLDAASLARARGLVFLALPGHACAPGGAVALFPFHRLHRLRSALARGRRHSYSQPMKRQPTNIARDNSRIPGWLVQVVRRGQLYNKRFSDSTHGGQQKALEKARLFRDRLLRVLPVRSATRTGPGRGKSGISGVEEHRRKGRVVRFRATWFERGRRRSRSFSVADYGHLRARELAIDTRKAAEAAILAPRGVLPVKKARAGPSPGVHLEQVTLPSGRLYRAYGATWYDAAGRPYHRSFSIAKHGAKKAFALAMDARMRGLRQRRNMP